MQSQLDFDPASSILGFYWKHRATNWSFPTNTWWENSSVEMNPCSFHGTKPENCRFIYQSCKATQTPEKHLHSVSPQTSNHKLRTLLNEDHLCIWLTISSPHCTQSSQSFHLSRKYSCYYDLHSQGTKEGKGKKHRCRSIEMKTKKNGEKADNGWVIKQATCHYLSMGLGW